MASSVVVVVVVVEVVVVVVPTSRISDGGVFEQFVDLKRCFRCGNSAILQIFFRTLPGAKRQFWHHARFSRFAMGTC